MNEPKYIAVPVLHRHSDRMLCSGCAFWSMPLSGCQAEFQKHIGHSCAPQGFLDSVAIENTPEAKAAYAAARLEE